MSDPSIVRLRAVIEAGLAALEAHREEVNALNVFPVADGDTGDNMVSTLRAVVQELDRLAPDAAHTPSKEIDRDKIVASVARAALLGARGSSGVILSQLIRGAAEELASRPGELIDPVLICAAMARAADQAYGSVRAPAEGTILTVVRGLAARMASELAHMRETRLPADASAAEQNALLAELVERALGAAASSAPGKTEQLPALRGAGAFDAGGYGLLVMLSGMAGALRGLEPPPLARGELGEARHPEHSSDTYRYCINFAVTGVDLDPRAYVSELEALGDTVQVAADASTLRVHLHTDRPNAATALFADAGTISHLEVADMRAAATSMPAARGSERVFRSSGDEVCGALALAGGAGIRALFESFGAHVVDSGDDLLAALPQIHAEEVVVLPNQAHALRAARRAAELSEKTVCVVASRSYQAGLAAAALLDPSAGARENGENMARKLARIKTGSVGPAGDDDPQGRFQATDAVGLVDDELVVWGQPRETLRAVLERLADGAELITCLRGSGAPLDDRTVQALAAGEVEFELFAGGQRDAWWLLCAE